MARKRKIVLPRAAVKAARRFDSPQRKKIVNVQNQYFFSVYEWPAGPIETQEASTFTTGIGGSGQGFTRMTKAQTNMKGNVFADALAFNCYGVGIYPYWGRYVAADPDADDMMTLKQFLEDTVLIHVMETREDNYGPLIAWPAGFGVDWRQVNNSPGATSKSYVVNNGVPAAFATKRFQEPVQIEGGRIFSWDMLPTAQYTFGFPLRIGVFLYGLMGKVLGSVDVRED